jgi:hypothetical protein
MIHESYKERSACYNCKHMSCEIEDNCNKYFCWIDGDMFPEDPRDGINPNEIPLEEWYRLCDTYNSATMKFRLDRTVKPSSICDKWELGEEP